MRLLCPYCESEAKLVTGDIIYPHRKDLYNLTFWQCKPCDAYVGTHKNSKNVPLGRLANAELRKAKKLAHHFFDPLWKHGNMKRKEAYKWLAKQLNIEVCKCHIGMFNVQMCNDVVEICTLFRKGYLK